MKTAGEMLRYVETKNYSWNAPKEYFDRIETHLQYGEAATCVIPTGSIEKDNNYITDGKSLIVFTNSRIICVGGKPFSEQMSPVTSLPLSGVKSVTSKKFGLSRLVIINSFGFQLTVQVHKNDVERVLSEVQTATKRAVSDTEAKEKEAKFKETDFNSSKPLGKKVSYVSDGEIIEVICNYNLLCICNCTKLQKTEIKKNSILHYKLNGDIQYTNEISGGGVNIGNAVTGGLLFGAAGAIIGAGVGTEIKTNQQAHDNRTVDVLYYCNENSRQQSMLRLPYSCYEILLDCFPEKEQSAVLIDSVKAQKVEATTEKNDSSIISQLKELKELVDSGVITQEEFIKIKSKLI